ncbi:hypothetical protein DVA86_30535 [Streptomyces armeniacus]|uniref:Uncharacterized protein n=1 Tax=Streptomyces armeniacus TaxID=83291 RepID=A0A345XXB5_9ACTN|nr:DUF5995 family protein [Streptomyces armeniacus]AXK36281.1 hypothetical protein DVA86_30535 [Streptomyces armeniacus]
MPTTTTSEQHPVRGRRRPALRGLLAGTALATAMSTIPVTAAHATPADAAQTPSARAASACGTPLSEEEQRTVIALSDTSTLDGDDPLERFDEAVARNRKITAILVRHHDRRGLFAVGLDAMEREVMQPLLHETEFADPDFGHAFTPGLLRRYLEILHDEFLGRPVPPHWKRHFDLAHRCDSSPVRTAMTGYNAHLTVDVGESLADARAGLGDGPDYLTITGALLERNAVVVERTKQAYGVDLGGVWQLVATTGPAMYAISFVNGLGLQIPLAGPVFKTEAEAVWRTTDAVLSAATA